MGLDVVRCFSEASTPIQSISITRVDRRVWLSEVCPLAELLEGACLPDGLSLAGFHVLLTTAPSCWAFTRRRNAMPESTSHAHSTTLQATSMQYARAS